MLQILKSRMDLKKPCSFQAKWGFTGKTTAVVFTV